MYHRERTSSLQHTHDKFSFLTSSMFFPPCFKMSDKFSSTIHSIVTNRSYTHSLTYSSPPRSTNLVHLIHDEYLCSSGPSILNLPTMLLKTAVHSSASF